MSEQTHPTHFWLPVAILSGLGAAIFFGGWCVVDYLLVHSPRYPVGVHEYDWLILVAPIPILAMDYLLAPRLRSTSRLGVSLLALLLGLSLGIWLVLQFGIPFHWSIGGKL
jgi:hypothetical protein